MNSPILQARHGRLDLALSASGHSRLQSICEPLEIRRLMAASAVNDNFTVGQNGSIIIGDGSLLGNDVDLGSIAGFTQPANGTVTRDPATGRFIYTPKPGFSGPDSFTYTGRSFTQAGPGTTLYIGSGDLNGDGVGPVAVGGEVSVSGYRWSVETETDFPTSSGSGDSMVGKPNPGRFEFSVPNSAASPGFLAAVANGGTVDRLTLIHRVAGVGVRAPEFLRFTLSDVRFLDYQHDDGPDLMSAAQETFSVSFATLKLDFPQVPGVMGRASVTYQADIIKSAGGGLFPFATGSRTGNEGPVGVFLDVDSSVGRGTVQATSISFGLENTTSLPGGATGRSAFNTVRVTLPTGDPTATFLRLATAGTAADKVVLIRRSLSPSSGGSRATERVTLNSAFVRSLVTTGQGSAQTTTVELVFSSVATQFHQFMANGQLSPAVFSTWDVGANTGTGGANFGGATLAASPPPLLLDLGSGQIAVDTYTWAEQSTIPPAGAAGTTNPSFDNFTFTRKGFSKASTGLFQAAADQRTIPLIKLARRVAGRAVMQWELTAARIDSYNVSLDDTGVPVETFTVSAAKVKQTVNFTPAGNPVSSSFDLRNKTFTGPTDFAKLTVPATVAGLVLDFRGASNAALGQFLVSNMNWDVSNPLTPGDTAAFTGKPTINAVSFTAASSQASAALLLRAARGGPFRVPTVTLTARRLIAGVAREFVKYTFTNVAIGSYGISDDAAAGATGLVDQFTLHFDSVVVKHTPIGDNGAPGTARTATINAKANTIAGAGAFPLATPLPASVLNAAGSWLQATGPETPLTASEAGAINVRSFNYDINNLPRGKAAFGPVTVTLESGTASATFLRAAAKGAGWSEIVLTNGAGGATPFVRHRLTLFNAAVSSFQTSVDAESGAPVDVITFTYDRIQTQFTPTDAIGKPAAPLLAGWDVAANTLDGENSLVPEIDLPATRPFVLDVQPSEMTDIEVNSFSWGESNTESELGVRGRSGEVRFTDFTITAPTGSASAGLFRAVATGNGNVDNISFRGRSLTSGKEEFASEWELDGVSVVGYSMSIDGQSQATDTFRLRAKVVRQETFLLNVSQPMFVATWNSMTDAGTTPSNFGGRFVPGTFTTATATVNIAVNRTNSPPSGFSLSSTFIDVGDPGDPTDDQRITTLEDPSDGTIVGTLSGGDPDAGDFVTFSLVNTAGGRFSVVGTGLSGSASVRVADGGRIAGNSRYTVTVRATDRAGDTRDQDFVIDVPAVTFTANGVLIINCTDGDDRISFTQASPTAPLIPTLNGLTISGSGPDGVGFLATQLIVNGGDGNDLIGAAQVRIPTILRGGAGNDFIAGGTAADRLEGGAGADSLNGNDGNDVAIGDGLDTVNLGIGQDGVLFKGTPGNDTIVIDIRVFRLPEDPHPELNDAQFKAAAEAGLVAHGHSAVMRINGTTVDNPYSGGETVFLLAGAGNDKITVTPLAGKHWRMNIRGEAGNDTITGGVLNDLLFGDGGDDTLDGGDGDDFLDGGIGQDVLKGGQGADSLLGGADSDDFFGGAGNDMISARDSVLDSIDGGGGFDKVRKDDGDLTTAVEEVLA